MVFKNSMLLLCVGACFLSGVLWSNEQVSVNQADLFTIMSFNVRRDGPEKKSIHKWKQRKDSVRILLQTQTTMPSVICFQEPVLSQVQDIASFLPNYQWFGQSRGKQWLGMARDEYLPIFFDGSRFRFIAGGFFVLNQGTKNPFKWKKHGKIGRIATWVCLLDTTTQKSFFVYNIHLDHQYEDVRSRAVRVLVDHINSHVSPDQTVFVAGDFNTPFDGLIKQLFIDNQFTHARVSAQTVFGPVNTSINWNGQEKSSIDHLFVRSGVNRVDVVDFTTLKTPEMFDTLPSDHYPVMATVKIE